MRRDAIQYFVVLLKEIRLSGGFRHISEIYSLEQSLFRSKKSKKEAFRSNFLFFRSKKSKK